MRILALCGSLQKDSSNLTLLRTARQVAPPGVEVAVFEGLGALPHFNPDLEPEGAPPSVVAFREALRASDAVLIASPEYGHSLPGVLKNAIDWVIGTGELERKVVAITAAVAVPERGVRGLKALADTLRAVSAVLVGGQPIVRGPRFEAAVLELVSALVERANGPVPEPDWVVET